MTNEQAAERLREYADMLERANVHDDMGLSLTLTQAADVMRDAAERLASLPPLKAETRAQDPT